MNEFVLDDKTISNWWRMEEHFVFIWWW
jgi:hypothetical protein